MFKDFFFFLTWSPLFQLILPPASDLSIRVGARPVSSRRPVSPGTRSSPASAAGNAGTAPRHNCRLCSNSVPLQRGLPLFTQGPSLILGKSHLLTSPRAFRSCLRRIRHKYSSHLVHLRLSPLSRPSPLSPSRLIHKPCVTVSLTLHSRQGHRRHRCKFHAP